MRFHRAGADYTDYWPLKGAEITRGFKGGETLSRKKAGRSQGSEVTPVEHTGREPG